MKDSKLSMTDRYEKWNRLIEKSARMSIGKSTVKAKTGPKPSCQMLQMRKERRQLKRKFEGEKNGEAKKKLLDEYVTKQKEVQLLAEEEEKTRCKQRFEKMMEHGVNGFWKERKAINRDDGADWLIMKDENGQRVFDPERNKDIIADHYEKLYSKGDPPHHPYHDIVTDKMAYLSTDRSTNEKLDTIPTKKEIGQAINNKKNGKATSDWKNEMIKKGGEPMIDLIYPVIQAFWSEEEPPRQWNEGVIRREDDESERHNSLELH